MKRVFFALFLLGVFSEQSWADSPMADYGYGNQITGSILRISSNQDVFHTERSCCPPHTNSVEEFPLPGVQYCELERWIDGAKNGKIETIDLGLVAMGSSFGSLMVGSFGERTVIRRIFAENGRRLMEINRSKEAREIEQLVLGYVSNKML